MAPVPDTVLPIGFRSLRWRIPAIAALVILAITATCVLGSYVLIARHGVALELDRADQATKACDDILHDQIDRLASTLCDYAQWDAAQLFLRGTYPDFTKSDLTDASRIRLGLAAVMMCDRQGAMRLVLVDGRTVPSLIPPAGFEPGSALQRVLVDAIGHPRSGLVWFQGEPALFAAAPVLSSQCEGESAGACVFILRFDHAKLERLGRQIAATSITARRAPQPTAEVRDLSAGHLRIDHQWPLLEEGQASFDLIFPRRYGQEVAVMTLAIGGAIALSGLLVMLTIGWLIDHLVLRRIGLLAKQAVAWGGGQRPDPCDSHASRFDEIGVLTRSVTETCDNLIAARQQAETANQAKSTFLAVISHDIRNPLTGILGLTDLLLRGPLDRSQREPLEMISRSGASLLSLLTGILDLSKIEAGALELVPAPCSPMAMIDEVAVLFRSLAASGVSVTSTASPDVPAQILADANRLRQILWNLVGNAVKFTRHGTIRIAASCATSEAGMHQLLISVHDSGPGISPEELARLFQPFRQAAAGRAAGGTGLGLMISRRLAVLMGGDITVTSTPGQGSTFTASLRLVPAIAAEQPTATATLARDLPRTGPPLRILVAEDDPVNQCVVRGMLTHLGVDVLIVATGAEAMMQAETGSFDLVLMDYHMSDMDGATATRRIRHHEAQSGAGHVPIIGLTAEGRDSEVQALRAAGMDEVLLKPVMLDDLAAMIERYRRRDPSTTNPM